MSRFTNLQSQPTVLIVGGGINGAGLFRDLALHGVDVLLVDKGDFCAGASAASSRMIHGGLRYLENGEFRLVRESLRERNLLLRNAAHFVRPLPACMPLFDRMGGLLNSVRSFLRLGGRPGRRGALIVAIGLTLYDLLSSRYRAMPTHSFSARAEALTLRPALNPAITCTASYYDAWITYPERLGLELILDGMAAHDSAQALSYARLQSAAGATVILRDEISGATCAIQPQFVVNATGAWIDFTNSAIGRSTSLIGGTKGSHLIVDHQELLAACQNQMLWYENADGRICIFFPFHDKVLVGSTDIPVDDPEAARCDEDEIAYMLAAVRQVFPAIVLDRSHVVSFFCGVRPLPRSNAATAGQISRDHSCVVLPPGQGLDFPIYALVGGKWTTFRAFAAEVADRLLAELGQLRRFDTENLAIGGGRDYPTTPAARRQWLAQLHARSGLELERLEQLLERYGTRAAGVVDYLALGADALLPGGYSRREVGFIVEHELVERLEDLVLRRSALALLGRLDSPLLEELAAILGAHKGWDVERISTETERTRELLETIYGVRVAPPNPRPETLHGTRPGQKRDDRR